MKKTSNNNNERVSLNCVDNEIEREMEWKNDYTKWYDDTLSNVKKVRHCYEVLNFILNGMVQIYKQWGDIESSIEMKNSIGKEMDNNKELEVGHTFIIKLPKGEGRNLIIRYNGTKVSPYTISYRKDM